MSDYTAVVDALDRLTEAVSNSQSSFWADFVSTILAIVGSVLSVLIFEIIRIRYFAPREEFRKLRTKTNSILELNKRYYYNPRSTLAHPMMLSAKTVEDYIIVGTEIRKLASDIVAFAESFKGKKCCGIRVEDICSAASELVSIANSLINNTDERSGNENHTSVNKINELLGIVKSK